MGLKAEIYQLKDEAKIIKKESDGLKQGDHEKLQKCYSARDLLHGGERSENCLEGNKVASSIYRMTLPTRSPMF